MGKLAALCVVMSRKPRRHTLELTLEGLGRVPRVYLMATCCWADYLVFNGASSIVNVVAVCQHVQHHRVEFQLYLVLSARLRMVTIIR